MAAWDSREADQQRLERLTLQYLLRHRRAMDTPEGIAAWWIRQQRVEEAVEDVHRALDMLVGRGLVLERRRPGRSSYYQLNRERIADVTRFLEEPDS